MKEYYYLIEDGYKGPFTKDELMKENLSSKTLVWADHFEEWTEIDKVEELQGSYKKILPPLPTQKRIESKIKVRQDSKEKTANEIKTNAKIFAYSLIIITIILSLILFIKNDGYENLKMYYAWNKQGNVWDEQAKILSIKSDNLGYKTNRMLYSFRDEFHYQRTFNIAEDSLKTSLITGLITAMILILIRYISKFIKWVNFHSTK